jgi:L-malate glycosyltransferase
MRDQVYCCRSKQQMSVDRIAMVGPVSPRDVLDLLDAREATRVFSGYRGIPTTDLARALVARGAEVEAFTTADEVDETTEFRGPHFRLVVVPRRSPYRRAADFFALERKQLAAALRTSDAQVVHAQWTYEFALAALDMPRPAVVTAHDSPWTIVRYSPDPYRLMRALMACRVPRRLHRLVAVSPYLAEKWRRQMRYEGRMTVIPNIVSPPESRPLTRRRTWSEPLVLCISDNSPRKNVVAVVEAVRLLQKSGHEVRLRIVGPGLGPDDRAARLAREQRMPYVSFHGAAGREELVTHLAEATLFVHPSREESFGLAVAEAMAAGLPVVAGVEAGAIPWLLDHGRAGVLANVRDPYALAGAIRHLLCHERYAQDLATAGRTRVLRNFNPATVAESYQEEYEAAFQEYRRADVAKWSRRLS